MMHKNHEKYYLHSFININLHREFFYFASWEKNVTETPKTIIDSFVVNASFTEYNSDGQLKTKVTAEKVTHFQPEGTSVFKTIYYYLHQRSHTLAYSR